MTDELQLEHKRKRAKELEDGNQRSFTELKQGLRQEFNQPFDMDTGDARREMFFKMLVEEWGVVTEEQYLDYEIKFHEKVEAELNNVWTQFREAKAKKGLVIPSTSHAKLLGPDGNPVL